MDASCPQCFFICCHNNHVGSTGQARQKGAAAHKNFPTITRTIGYYYLVRLRLPHLVRVLLDFQFVSLALVHRLIKQVASRSMLGRQAVAIAYLSLRTTASFARHSSLAPPFFVSSSVMSASTSQSDADIEKVDIKSDIDATCAAGKCVPCESLDKSHRE